MNGSLVYIILDMPFLLSCLNVIHFYFRLYVSGSKLQIDIWILKSVPIDLFYIVNEIHV